MSNTQSSTNWVLGAALLLIGAFVLGALVMVRSQGQSNTQTSLTIANTPPIISSLVVADSATGALDSFTTAGSGVNLSSNSTQTIYVNVVVYDPNTDYDLDDGSVIEGSVYLNGATCASDTDVDRNNCYFFSDIDCDMNPVTGETQQEWSCAINLYSNADSTGVSGSTRHASGWWTVDMIVTDDSGGSVTESSSNFHVNSLLSVGFPPNLTYPSTASGSTSSKTTYTMTNYGNSPSNIKVSGTAMSCTHGVDIPVGSQSYSNTSTATGIPLTTTPVLLMSSSTSGPSNLIGYKTDTTDATGSSYHDVTVGNQSGSCSGTLTMTATTDSVAF